MCGYWSAIFGLLAFCQRISIVKVFWRIWAQPADTGHTFPFSGNLLRVTTSAHLAVSTYQTRKQFTDFKMFKIPIPILTTKKSYERYKTELNCWLKLSSLEKSKQGLAVALSLLDSHPSKMKDTMFTQLTVDELSGDKGIEKVIKLFDKHLGKDSLSDAFDKFNDF